MKDVYFIDPRAEVTEPEKWYQPQLSLTNKLKKLIHESGILDSISRGDLVAVKTHFGDRGTTRVIRSVFIRTVVDSIREAGGRPFVTETTGLGLIKLRSTAIGRLQIAEENGFTSQTLNAPIIIADGLLGLDFVEVDVNGRYLDKVYVAKSIAECDAVVCCTHFKLHMQAGIGGSIKNVGVGCVAKPSKFDVHANNFPRINEKCTRCGKCVKICPANAIIDFKINTDRCLKCTGCYEICEDGAIDIDWSESIEIVYKIVECAKGVLKVNKNFSYINFLLDVTPHCDCHPFSDVPVIPDIGILASKDIVAIDNASIEMYRKAPKIGFLPRNKFWEWTKPYEMIEYAEKIGLGVRSYRVMRIQ